VDIVPGRTLIIPGPVFGGQVNPTDGHAEAIDCAMNKKLKNQGFV
jgi:hypothetical protein